MQGFEPYTLNWSPVWDLNSHYSSPQTRCHNRVRRTGEYYGGGGENRTPTKSLQSSQAPITSHPHIETHSNSFPSFALTASVLEVNVFQYGAPRGT